MLPLPSKEVSGYFLCTSHAKRPASTDSPSSCIIRHVQKNLTSLRYLFVLTSAKILDQTSGMGGVSQSERAG
jgi:hypothetical protein